MFSHSQKVRRLLITGSVLVVCYAYMMMFARLFKVSVIAKVFGLMSWDQLSKAVSCHVKLILLLVIQKS